MLHSTTKYLNGHSDMIGGMLVVNREDLAERLGFIQNASGAVPGPMDCFLCLRGTKTLPLRMARHDAERSPHRRSGSPSGRTSARSTIPDSRITRSSTWPGGR